MKKCTICRTCSQTLKFNLGRFTPDEKLAFIEGVCGLLVQSRFGMDRVYEELAGSHPIYEGDRDAFFADAKTFVPPRVNRKLARLLDMIKTTASLFTRPLETPATQNRSPSTMGRGSPIISRSEDFPNSYLAVVKCD